MNVKSPHFEAIFFDMDGLLVDTEPLALRATQEVFSTIGIEVSTEWYINERLRKAKSTSTLLEERGLPQDQIEAISARRKDRYQELLRTEAKAIDGVEDVLKNLQGHLITAVVTSSAKDSFEIIMERTGFKKYFSFFITRDDVQNLKPHPEPYLMALERSQKTKAECLVLEDSQQGLLAAKAAELTCFAIPGHLTKTHDFSTADKVLGSIREVPALVGL